MLYTSSDEFWRFSSEIARTRRYIRTPKAEEILKLVSKTCLSRLRELPQGWLTWRAQIGHDWERDENIDDFIPCPHPRERMKPLTNRAQEGRVNPKGIPCLYLATMEETAISEVRPWIGSLVSLAQFRLTKTLRVIDCSVRHEGDFRFHSKPLTSKQREEAIWASIDHAFSEPITQTDDVADYAATQVLAELFKSEGYDGVVYKSAFGKKGYNIALFDVHAADLINCTLYKVKSVQYDFRQDGNTYFLPSTDSKP